MHPSKHAELILGILIPPACREEVLGDLYERYRSPLRYAWDAICIVPLVILSRIRRTSDPLVVLTQALALYTSFLCAARIASPQLLVEPWGQNPAPGRPSLRNARRHRPRRCLCRPAQPILPRSYPSHPHRHRIDGLVAGALMGGSVTILRSLYHHGRYGCVLSLVFSTGVRMLFPPATNALRGVTAPAKPWLKQSAAPVPADLPAVRQGDGPDSDRAPDRTGRLLADLEAGCTFIVISMPPTRPLAAITGASAGIGATFARASWRPRGSDLILIARRADRLQSLAAELSQKHGMPNPKSSSPTSMSTRTWSVVAQRLAAIPDLDVLINNAGFGVLPGLFAASSPYASAEGMHKLHVMRHSCG